MILAALGCAAALVLVAGGDDDEESPETTATTAATPDLGRYCELVAALDRNSNAIFEEVGAAGVPPRRSSPRPGCGCWRRTRR